MSRIFRGDYPIIMSKVLIGVDKSGAFRVYLTVTTKMVEEARKIHNTSPVATATLGRVLTAAGIMGVMLKGSGDKVTLIFKGDGPAEQVLATAAGTGNVKGYIANPDVDLPLTSTGKLDVGGAVGIGELTVIKDMGLKEPYSGKIALVDGEIADDLTAYFFISEQQNSSVALGVKVDVDYSVKAAGGMIIQMLPGGELTPAVDALEEMLAKLPPLTTIIEEVVSKAPGKTEEGIMVDLADRIFGGMEEEYHLNILEYRDIQWECDCSRERIEQALITIGRKDLHQIIEEDGKAELVCSFCTKRYNFDKDELVKIYESI